MTQKWLNHRVLFQAILWTGLVLLLVSTSVSGAADPLTPVSLSAGSDPAPQGLTADEWMSIKRQIQADTSSLDPDYLPPRLVKKLVAGDIVANDAYGISVALSGDTLVVGTYHAAIGGLSQRGAAYIFYRNHGAIADNWGEAKKIFAFDGTTDDYFGISVAISGDTIVVGASGDDIDSQSNKGSAYIFYRNQGGADQWGLVKKIVAGDGAASDWFGESVAISGEMILVGSPYDDIGIETDQGSAHVFYRNNGGTDYWGEIAKLTASDGLGANYFGTSVAISGVHAVVGAYGADVLGNLGQGAAYVFSRNQGGTANSWGQAAKLTAGDGDDLHRFGYAVAINGQSDTVVVGAYFAAVSGMAQRGAAYVFTRNQGGTANSWGQAAKLVASDGAGGDNFGKSVAVNGEYIMVGAPGDESKKGAAYVYFRNKGGAAAWGEINKLTAPDGAAADEFGFAVAGNLEADTFVVGAPGDDSWRGSAYLYSLNGNNWVQQRKTTASDGANYDYFGVSTALSGDTLVVGAQGDDSYKGAAYVFSRNWGGADQWGQVAKLTASDGEANDYFGGAVAISADTIVVGACGDDYDKGAAYVFLRNQGGADHWGQKRKLLASNGAANEYFGISVAISGDTLVVGADQDDSNNGSAFIFSRNQGGSDNWGGVKTLTNPDSNPDYFGFSVAIDGDNLVVGAWLSGSVNGAAYVFSRNQGGADNWGQVKKLNGSDSEVADRFGHKVAINQGTILVGAPLHNGQRGAAYLFSRNQGGVDNWGQIKKLVVKNGKPDDKFGWSLDITGNTIVGGSINTINGQSLELIFLFARNQNGPDQWGQVKKLTAADATPWQSFSYDVSIDGNTFVAGAHGDNANRGAAYVFEVEIPRIFLPLIFR